MSTYLLEVSLLDAPQPIWRRFVVPGHIALDKLHLVIQTVMGWRNKHMHSFFIGQQQYLPKNAISEGTLREDHYCLNALAPDRGAKLHYLYDFSDRWMHEIVIEDIDYPNPERPVYCLDGAGQCPPEECGGMNAFWKFCEAMRDKKHPLHEEQKAWHGRLFYPDRFDLAKVNAAFGIQKSQ